MTDIAMEAFAEALATVALKRRVSTRAVLAEAYPKRRKHKAFLTHSLREGSASTLCDQIQIEHLADEYASDAAARPTCRTCLRRDPRFKVPQNSDSCP